jgi:hypothetical protein
MSDVALAFFAIALGASTVAGIGRSAGSRLLEALDLNQQLPPDVAHAAS